MAENSQPEIQESVVEVEKISPEEYKRRLSIIQESTFETLRSRDAEFAGDDGVEGLLIFGSYAKSHPSLGENILVHDRSGSVYSSDVDVYTLIRQRGEDLDDATNNEQSFSERLGAIPQGSITAENVGAVYQKYAVKGFTVSLMDTLKVKGLEVEVETMGSINLDNPEEVQHQLGDTMLHEGVIVLLPDTPVKEQIIAEIGKAAIPTVINPSSENRMVKSTK